MLLDDLDRPPGLIAGLGARMCCNGKCQGNKGNIGYVKCWHTPTRKISERKENIL